MDEPKDFKSSNAQVVKFKRNMKKTPSRELRVRTAKTWIKSYTGNNIVKGYSKKYNVDMLCAVKELRMIGVDITEEYENKLKQSLETLRKERLSSKLERDNEERARGFDSDGDFSMILGYTSG